MLANKKIGAIGIIPKDSANTENMRPGPRVPGCRDWTGLSCRDHMSMHEPDVLDGLAH